MKTIFVLAAVLAVFAGNSQAVKIKLGAAVNGDKSISYQLGTSLLTVSKTTAELLPTLANIAQGVLSAASNSSGTTVQVTVNDNGSLTLGTSPNTTLSAALVKDIRSVLAFAYNTISNRAQQRAIVGLY